MWGGFVCGKLDKRKVDDHWGGENNRPSPAIFTSYKEARRQYRDVRSVQVLYLEGPTK